MKKKIIFFMPSFEGGGVEKNIILIANYFIKKNPSISIITSSKYIKKKNLIIKSILFLQLVICGISVEEYQNI